MPFLHVFLKARRSADHHQGKKYGSNYQLVQTLKLGKYLIECIKMSNTGYHLTYFCYFLRLIWSLQNFTAAVAIINNNDTIRNNFALQIHEINLETVVLPQVFVANLGDIDQLQVANSSITEDDFPAFSSMSDIEGQPTAYASLPESLFVPGNDTVLRVNYAVFFNDVLFQLRSMSELAEIYETFETGSIIISARVGSGSSPENITDPGAVFFFQKSEVGYLSLYTD